MQAALAGLVSRGSSAFRESESAGSCAGSNLVRSRGAAECAARTGGALIARVDCTAGFRAPTRYGATTLGFPEAGA